VGLSDAIEHAVFLISETRRQRGCTNREKHFFLNITYHKRLMSIIAVLAVGLRRTNVEQLGKEKEKNHIKNVFFCSKILRRNKENQYIA
jgi:hypothetical protein